MHFILQRALSECDCFSLTPVQTLIQACFFSLVEQFVLMFYILIFVKQLYLH